MINVVREKVKEFLMDVLDIKAIGENVRIVSLTPSADGWLAEAEVIEKDRALPRHRVFEKKYYLVKVSSDMEISFYKQVKDKCMYERE